MTSATCTLSRMDQAWLMQQKVCSLSSFLLKKSYIDSRDMLKTGTQEHAVNFSANQHVLHNPF